MAKNSKLNQKYKGYDKKNIDQKGLMLSKSKWNKNYYVVFLGLEDCIFKSTYSLVYEYHASNLGIDFRFNREFLGSYDRKNTIIGSNLL